LKKLVRGHPKRKNRKVTPEKKKKNPSMNKINIEDHFLKKKRCPGPK